MSIYRDIPPPNKTFYSYTQGFPIHKIDIPQIQKDSYGIPRGIIKVLQGGIGQPIWSAEFIPTITKFPTAGLKESFFLTNMVTGTVGDTVVGRVEGMDVMLNRVVGWTWVFTPPGAGQYGWSPQWIAENERAFPEIKIYVWKKDFHAKTITSHTNLKAKVIQNLTICQNDLKEIELKIESLAKSFFTQQNLLAEKPKQLNVITDECALLLPQLEQKQIECEVSSREWNLCGPSIRSLIDFLAISEELGLPLDHPAIAQFRLHLDGISQCTCLERNRDHLLTHLVESWPKIVEAAKCAEKQDIVAVVGKTGVGKSTLVNHLLGITMHLNDNKKIVVKNRDEEVAKIGHRPATSETLMAQVCTTKHSPLKVADCGGFFDTRETKYDITVSASVKKTIEASSSVQILLCIWAPSLTDRTFTEQLELMLGRLFRDFKQASNSVALLITHPPILRNGMRFSTRDALDALEDILEDVKGTSAEALLKFILRENGKYVYVYNPLSDDSRAAVLEMLKSMSPMQETAQIIASPYTLESIEKVLNSAIAIASDATAKYEKRQTLLKERDMLQQKIADLKVRSTDLHQSTQTIALTIQSTQSAEIAEEKKLSPLRDRIRLLTDEAKQHESEITKLNTTDLIIFSCKGGGFSKLD